MITIKKLFVFLIIFILLIPSISSNALSQTGQDNDDSSKRPIIDRLLKLRFRLGFLGTIQQGRYFYQQLRPPVAIQSFPSAVDLRYLNEKNIQIGGKNPDTLEWEPMIKVAGSWAWAWFNPKIIYSFEFVPPEDAPGDVWNVQFDPEYLIMDTNKENLDWPGAEDPFKTNVTIMLKTSADPTYPSQDVVLKVNVIREELIDYLRILQGEPKWVRTHQKEFIEKMNDLDPDKPKYWNDFTFRIMWRLVSRRFFFITNLQFPPHDKWIDSTVEILIRVNKYHQAEIVPPLPLDIEPYQVKSIPVTITNLGSHIDTFNFRVRTTGENMVVTPPPVLTLKPGEQAQALVGVAAPKSFLSIGSTASIFVEAFSVDDPDTVFSNTIILTTIGVHATGGPTYNFILSMITLFIIIAIILYFLKKRRERITKKPDKPWDIPEEKKHLEKLIEKDTQKYNETLKMMREEYKSAVLWHKYYCDAILKKKEVPRRKIEIRTGLNKLFKKLGKIEKGIKKKLKVREEKSKAKKEKLKAKKEKLKIKKEKLKVKKEKFWFKKQKPLEKPVEEPKKIKKIKPEKIKKEEKIVDKKAELERIKRERVISKIRYEQEKQLRKIKG